MPIILTTAAAAVALAGCGNEPTKPPDVNAPQPPGALNPQRFPEQGLSFVTPANWRLVPGQGALVAAIGSGTANLAVWRYPRDEPEPKTSAEFQKAKDALVEAARKRDPKLKVSAKLQRYRGRPLIVLTGLARVNGRLRAVRSTHFFEDRSEVVVDAYAATPVFDQVDREVFGPVLASMRVRDLPRPAKGDAGAP